jgi:hypothetical protein
VDDKIERGIFSRTFGSGLPVREKTEIVVAPHWNFLKKIPLSIL